MDLLWLAVALVILVPILINLAVVFSVYKMGRPGTHIKPAPADRYTAEFELARIHHDWATRAGFNIVGGYVYEANAPIFIAAWQYGEDPTWFCIYVSGNRTHFDLVTQLSATTGLTTGSTPDSSLLPRPPGSYMQAFPGLSPSELWRRHQEGLAFLKPTLNLPPFHETRTLEILIDDSIKRQVAYIKTVPAWWLRGCYWYYVRRRLLSNKPVEQLFQQGPFSG